MGGSSSSITKTNTTSNTSSTYIDSGNTTTTYGISGTALAGLESQQLSAFNNFQNQLAASQSGLSNSQVQPYLIYGGLAIVALITFGIFRRK